MVLRRLLLLSILAATGGCSGEFILTSPDVPVLAGQPAPVVVRLQRREFGPYAPPAEGSAITAKTADGALRTARTDKNGYAAVALDTPAQPGRLDVALYHQDILGDTVSGAAAVYVLSPDRPIVAVDLDCLPAGPASAGAAGAVQRLAREAQVIYLSTELAQQPRKAHYVLSRAGCPDGAVVGYSRLPQWYEKAPWRADALRPLVSLRQRLGNLDKAVTTDPAAAETFRQAGIKPLVVEEVPKGRWPWQNPKPGPKVQGAEYFRAWSALRLGPGGAD